MCSLPSIEAFFLGWGHWGSPSLLHKRTKSGKGKGRPGRGRRRNAVSYNNDCQADRVISPPPEGNQ